MRKVVLGHLHNALLSQVHSFCIQHNHLLLPSMQDSSRNPQWQRKQDSESEQQRCFWLTACASAFDLSRFFVISADTVFQVYTLNTQPVVSTPATSGMNPGRILHCAILCVCKVTSLCQCQIPITLML
jgi:hypothetical protein